MRQFLGGATVCCVLLVGCTGVTYHASSGDTTVQSFTTGDDGANDVPTTWKYEAPVRTVRGVDHSGVLCAALATFGSRANARNAAYQDAAEDGKDSFSYRYKLYTARQFTGGYCAGYVRWGSADGAITRTREGVGTDDAYDGETSMFEIGMEVGWHYELFSGMHASPIIRLGGGKYKWADPDGTGQESNVADMGVGMTFDFVPSWFYGVGLHIEPFFNAFGDGINIRGGFDFTLAVTEELAATIGMWNDLRYQGYNTEGFSIKSDPAGVMLTVNYMWE